jgi:hypothetical protein
MSLTPEDMPKRQRRRTSKSTARNSPQVRTINCSIADGLPTRKPTETSSPPLAQGNPRQLLTCCELDSRTSAAKAFDRLVADIESDLGGSDRLGAIERALVEGFAGATQDKVYTGG